MPAAQLQNVQCRSALLVDLDASCADCSRVSAGHVQLSDRPPQGLRGMDNAYGMAPRREFI